MLPASRHHADGTSSGKVPLPSPGVQVYRSCLYCTHDLAENGLLESQAVGRRLAFDGGRGRLWVICPYCAKWNLVPFDSRLETIDECERLFRETRSRYSTDSIGMARLPAGLDLIRIGSALKPEIAALLRATLAADDRDELPPKSAWHWK